MIQPRGPRGIGLLTLVGLLLLLAAGCASHRGALGFRYGPPAPVYAPVVYGAAFHLGRGVYQVVYDPGGYGYYFRTRALGPGRGCSRYCYARGRDLYHHSSCRRFGYLAHRYRTSPGYLIRAYGPR